MNTDNTAHSEGSEPKATNQMSEKELKAYRPLIDKVLDAAGYPELKKELQSLRDQLAARDREITRQGDTIVSLGKVLLKPNEKERYENELAAERKKNNILEKELRDAKDWIDKLTKSAGEVVEEKDNLIEAERKKNEELEASLKFCTYQLQWFSDNGVIKFSPQNQSQFDKAKNLLK